MFDEGSAKAFAAQRWINCHASQLKPFICFSEESAYTCYLIALHKAENEASAINDLAWISSEVSIYLLDREMLGDPQFIEPHKLGEVASVVCFDLHLRTAVESLTP